MWQATGANGWAEPEVAARFEAGARGEISTEAVHLGPRLTEFAYVKELLKWLELTTLEEAVILDYGCANGIYGEVFARSTQTRSWKYIGVDISASMIEACRSRFPDRRFEVVKAGEQIPLADESVDIIFASGVLDYIEFPEFILGEFHRITKSTVLLSRVPSRPGKPRALYLQTVEHPWGVEKHTFQVFNNGQLTKLINEAGFDILAAELSIASGEWIPPDDPEAVRQYTYYLRKAKTQLSEEVMTSSPGGTGEASNKVVQPDAKVGRVDHAEEIKRLRLELTESETSLKWIESRAADLQFEADTLRSRLNDSQEMRRQLENKLPDPKHKPKKVSVKKKPGLIAHLSGWIWGGR
jgi:ubiquinone/menaquinone biosynthesis C-methylase UbiE